MPLVRIDLAAGRDAKFRATLGRIVYEAMHETANVPADDMFQIFTQHASEELICPESYLGVRYSPDIVFIQITWVAGRSVETKKAFYDRVANQLHDRLGLRTEDVFISLVDAQREDWSFGQGRMQYAPD